MSITTARPVIRRAGRVTEVNDAAGARAGNELTGLPQLRSTASVIDGAAGRRRAGAVPRACERWLAGSA
ncbi:hypothetical protein J2S42_002360 [Catenuloplanes indicus]|uniref:Uncharacterized protein n=1 Tax=Catenuloplanes indicus TaxID=137267 RepID=A0AAE3VXK4_9ACTN|nr:hypothetical protein [Catenuloplanes indicus]